MAPAVAWISYGIPDAAHTFIFKIQSADASRKACIYYSARTRLFLLEACIVNDFIIIIS